MTYWKSRRALVTGGCSFIGSHLVDALVARGASVRIADDLSSGIRANVQHLLDGKAVEFLETDLLAPGAAETAVAGMEHVFHLAANHGGRGYIDLHQAACSTILAFNGLMIRAAHRGGSRNSPSPRPAASTRSTCSMTRRRYSASPKTW